MLVSFASVPRRTRATAVGLTLSALGGCGHEWDSFDPRLGSTASAGGGGASASGTGPGAGGASTSASSGGVGASGAGGTAGSTGSSSSGAAGGGAGGGGGAAGAGGMGTTCKVNGAQNVNDDFDDGVMGAEWEVYADNVTVTESGGAAELDLAPGALSSTYAEYKTVATYDLTDCDVFAKVVAVPLASTQGYAALNAHASNGDYVELKYVGGDLYFVYWLGGSQLLSGSVPYDPVTHLYWRLREAAGTLYWETSADGQTFVEQASMLDPLPVDAMDLRIVAGTYQVEPIAPGKVRYDTVNLVR